MSAKNTNFPLDNRASMVDRHGVELPKDLLVDLSISYIWHGNVYDSSDNLNPDLEFHFFISSVVVQKDTVGISISATFDGVGGGPLSTVVAYAVASRENQSQLISLQKSPPGYMPPMTADALPAFASSFKSLNLRGFIVMDTGSACPESQIWVFEDPKSSLVEPKLVHRMTCTWGQQPVHSFNSFQVKAGDQVTDVYGDIELHGSGNLQVTRKTLNITQGGSSLENGDTDCLVIGMDTEAPDFAETLREFAGPCSNRADTNTCHAIAIQSINGVVPDSEGNIYLVFSPELYPAATKSSGDNAPLGIVVVDTPVTQDMICATGVPDVSTTGRLSNVGLCPCGCGDDICTAPCCLFLGCLANCTTDPPSGPVSSMLASPGGLERFYNTCTCQNYNELVLEVTNLETLKTSPITLHYYKSLSTPAGVLFEFSEIEDDPSIGWSVKVSPKQKTWQAYFNGMLSLSLYGMVDAGCVGIPSYKTLQFQGDVEDHSYSFNLGPPSEVDSITSSFIVIVDQIDSDGLLNSSFLGGAYSRREYGKYVKVGNPDAVLEVYPLAPFYFSLKYKDSIQFAGTLDEVGGALSYQQSIQYIPPESTNRNPYTYVRIYNSEI